jgi:hypothetical protein
MSNRKGFVQDAITIVISLFTISVLFIAALSFFSGVSAGMNSTLTTPETQQGKDIAVYTNDNVDWVLDFLFAMLFISLPIASMILAFFNNIPSFFFFGSLGLVLLVVIIGGAFGEAWISSSADSNFGIQAVRMPITNIILSNFGLYSLFIMVIILVGTYVKMSDSNASY